MKKFIKLSYLMFVFLSCSLFFIGCSKNEISAEFVRLDRIERQNSNDYCLDFTIKFDNKTDHDEIILQSDFDIKINNEQKTDIVFLYTYEETFILGQPTIKSQEELSLRIRITSTIKDREYNAILLKYKNKTLIEDNIYMYDIKKQGQ